MDFSAWHTYHLRNQAFKGTRPQWLKNPSSAGLPHFLPRMWSATAA